MESLFSIASNTIVRIQYRGNEFKAKHIALASVLQIELSDGNRREQTCCRKTSADATLSPLLEPSV